MIRNNRVFLFTSFILLIIGCNKLEDKKEFFRNLDKFINLNEIDKADEKKRNFKNKKTEENNKKYRKNIKNKIKLIKMNFKILRINFVSFNTISKIMCFKDIILKKQAFLK